MFHMLLCCAPQLLPLLRCDSLLHCFTSNTQAHTAVHSLALLRQSCNAVLCPLTLQLLPLLRCVDALCWDVFAMRDEEATLGTLLGLVADQVGRGWRPAKHCAAIVQQFNTFTCKPKIQ